MDNKTSVVAHIISRRYNNIDKLLVVGCGSGIEAAILGDELHTSTIGIDLADNFNAEAAKGVDLRIGDATHLDFDDNSFSFVYSYHALEHIPDYMKALGEMRRVLKDDGGYMVGTPNRSRLVGYLGSKDATLPQKIAWNGNDWKAMIQGKFKNEYGAHAGFTSSELKHALDDTLGGAQNITNTYYLGIYKNHANLIQLLIRSGLSRFLFPSVYFLRKK